MEFRPRSDQSAQALGGFRRQAAGHRQCPRRRNRGPGFVYGYFGMADGSGAARDEVEACCRDGANSTLLLSTLSSPALLFTNHAAPCRQALGAIGVEGAI